MTEKLYHEDCHLKEFTATVISVNNTDNGLFEIVLDKTAFFPGGGGQSCDHGYINDIEVVDMREEKDGTIVHVLSSQLTVGTKINGKIDWDTRFARMQNHSGEHIVSGIIHELFGYENVGFHMGSEDVTIDVAGVLTQEDLDKIELLANKAIWENVKFKFYYPEPDELQNFKYRSKLDLTENVRLVEVEGIDLCACCAPHVSEAAEIGIIKILDFINYKGGVRVHLLCGIDALNDYVARHKMEYAISTSLSVKQKELKDAVERLQAELTEKKRMLTEINIKMSEVLADKYTDTVNICAFEDLDQSALRNLVSLNSEKVSLLSAGFSGNDADGYRYVIASKNLDLRKLTKSINEGIGGRGGGKDMLEGKASKSKDEIISYIKNFTA